MIRINLLETAGKKRRKKRELPTGAPIIAIYVVLLALEGFLLFYWSGLKDEALAAQMKLTVEAQKKVEGFKQLKTERDELQGKMDEEKMQADLFKELRNATVGPGNTLLYLAYMLTTPPLENHAERVVQEQIGWDTQWDPDRAWFTTVKESKERELTISGQAISHHDTDEVLKRIKSSIYFQGVHFVSAKVGKGQGVDAVNLVEFKILAFLNYNPDVGKTTPEEEAKNGKQGAARKGARKKN